MTSLPSRRKRLAVLLTALLTLGAGVVLAGSGGAIVAQEPAGNLAQDAGQEPDPKSGQGRPDTEAAPVAATQPVAAKALDRPASDKTEANDTGTAAAISRASDRSRDPKVLPRRMRGPAAVRALGADLPAAASRSGISAAQLRRVLTTDRTAWVSETGRLFYMEALPKQTTGTTSATTAAVEPAYATGSTLALNSRPGAKRTIFLDFDGATVSGTAWNTAPEGAITAGTHIGYDSDGQASSFSTAEHGYIQEVWRQVSETYAAFDVNVTTQDSGTDAYIRTSDADQTYGSHVLITSSTTPQKQVCPLGCLGLAYIATFDQSYKSAYYQPAWVFAAGNYDPMVIAQAASHEAGHNLGLDHDATNANTSYYKGTTAWGPIMGSAMPRAVSQFSRGEYADANNLQDDFAVMALNGLPVGTDDHGNAATPTGARQLGALPGYAADGVISTRLDKDVFAIDLPCTTGLTVTAQGIGRQTTLDLSLEVLNQAGAVVLKSSPTSSYTGTSAVPVSANMDATLTVPNATGTYYLRVDGVGSGVATGTGWSDYGSLGEYSLAATGCAAGTTSTEPSPSATPSPSADPSTAPVAPPTTVTLTPTPTPTPTPVATKPGSPVIGTASSGYSGGTVSATARWAAPRTTGGAAITKYRVRAYKRDSRNRVIRTYYSSYFGSTTRALVWRLPTGRYSFQVVAYNRVGASSWSPSSAIVTAR